MAFIFQDRCLQPLGHPSLEANQLVSFCPDAPKRELPPEPARLDLIELRRDRAHALLTVPPSWLHFLTMRKKPDFVPVTIRFPRELHGMLTQAAYGVSPANSFNREIVERLYSTFKKEDELDDLRVRLAALEAQMREGK